MNISGSSQRLRVRRSHDSSHTRYGSPSWRWSQWMRLSVLAVLPHCPISSETDDAGDALGLYLHVCTPQENFSKDLSSDWEQGDNKLRTFRPYSFRLRWPHFVEQSAYQPSCKRQPLQWHFVQWLITSHLSFYPRFFNGTCNRVLIYFLFLYTFLFLLLLVFFSCIYNFF